MLTEEEIRKLRPYLQVKIDSMKNLTKGYKLNAFVDTNKENAHYLW